MPNKEEVTPASNVTQHSERWGSGTNTREGKNLPSLDDEVKPVADEPKAKVSVPKPEVKDSKKADEPKVATNDTGPQEFTDAVPATKTHAEIPPKPIKK